MGWFRKIGYRLARRKKAHRMRRIDKIVVHCTDTADSIDYGVAEIRRYHVDDLGWKDVGYHFVIRRNGEIELGRPLEEVGAHCRGYNRGSIGIVLVGRRMFCEEQFAALRGLVNTLMCVFGELPVWPHSFFNRAKMCPNFNVTEVLKSGL